MKARTESTRGSWCVWNDTRSLVFFPPTPPSLCSFLFVCLSSAYLCLCLSDCLSICLSVFCLSLSLVLSLSLSLPLTPGNPLEPPPPPPPQSATLPLTVLSFPLYRRISLLLHTPLSLPLERFLEQAPHDDRPSTASSPLDGLYELLVVFSVRVGLVARQQHNLCTNTKPRKHRHVQNHD